jgi:hypothetical protein
MTRQANDFRIWQVGKPAAWDCTAQEIAADTGISVHTVKATCKRRGWGLSLGQQQYDDPNRPSLVSIMSNPYAGNAQ